MRNLLRGIREAEEGDTSSVFGQARVLLAVSGCPVVLLCFGGCRKAAASHNTSMSFFAYCCAAGAGERNPGVGRPGMRPSVALFELHKHCWTRSVSCRVEIVDHLQSLQCYACTAVRTAQTLSWTLGSRPTTCKVQAASVIEVLVAEVLV